VTEALLLVHVLAVVVWLGSGFMGQVLAAMADRHGDARTFARLVGLIGELTLTLFVPASLVALLTGVALVLDGPASFGDLWILVALAGFAATFTVGAAVLGPRAQAFGVALAADGGALGQDALDQGRAVLRIARFELVVLVLVVAVMVVKPGL
jgi:uncharacterized membrane protein